MRPRVNQPALGMAWGPRKSWFFFLKSYFYELKTIKRKEKQLSALVSASSSRRSVLLKAAFSEFDDAWSIQLPDLIVYHAIKRESNIHKIPVN